MAIIRTTRYHIEWTNIDKNGNLNIVYPKNTVDDVYLDPKKNVTMRGKGSFYGATAVEANVQTIDVSVPGFQLVEGAHVTILFEKGITASNPKLRINNGIQTLAAVPIMYRKTALPSNLIKANGFVHLVYSVGSFHVIHQLITPPLSVDNGRKIFLTGVDTANAKAYPDQKYYDSNVYVDTVEGRLHASTFIGTTYYMGSTSAYINASDYTGNSATTTKFKTARNITIGKRTLALDGTKNLNFTLAAIDAVAKDGDEMRGNLKITSEVSDDRYVLYKGNGINFVLPTGNGGFAGGISYVKPEDNTVEGTFGFHRGNYFYFGESYNNPNGTVKASKFIGNLTGTADVAKKLGTANVGTNTKFFYLNAGTATASTATVGSGIKPMFLNAGTFTASSSTIGSGTKPMYMNAGTLTAFSSTVGSTTKPIYMNAGVITASNATVGSTDTPVYMNAGVITSTGKTFSSYVPLAGGTMTGNLVMKNVYLNDGVNNRIVMQIFDDGDTANNGSELTITGAGNTFIGSGEGPTALRADLIAGNKPLGESHSKTSEVLYLTSDTEMYLMTNCQTIGNRKGLGLSTAATLYPLTNAASDLGTSTKKFRHLYLSNNASVGGTLSVTGRSTLSGKLTLPTTGGSWISGMTLTNPSIQIATKNSSASYHPIIGGQTYNSHFWNFGTITDTIGFYGFKNGRTANATDWGFTINVTNGNVNSTGTITAPSFSGTASSVSTISGHIRDDLTGNGVTNKALSANQGYQLKTSLDNHSHGLLHTSLIQTLANTTTDSGWSMINSSYSGGILKAIRTQANAPAWTLGNFSSAIAFGGADTKGIISCAYSGPSIKFAGGNGTKPVWWIGATGTSGKTYNLDKIDAAMPASYWHWSGQTGQPTWLWGGNANNDFYVWNPSNFSVANAAKCANLAPSHSTGANTIVTRQGNGYTFLNYINSNTTNNENPGISQVIVTNGSDNYYRKASLAHLKSSLKVPTMSLSGTTLTITL